MAVPELHFFAANDVNGATILEVPVDDDYVEALSARISLPELGFMKIRFSRQVGYRIFASGALEPETMIRLLIPDIADDRYVWACFLDDRVQQLVARIKAGEDFTLGGPGPKHYLSRWKIFPEQFVGTGWHLDRPNGVFRFAETASPGRVLNALKNESDANTYADFLPDLTQSFTDANDSASDAWTDSIAQDGELELRIGSSYLDTLFLLEEAGDLESTIFLGTVGTPRLRLDAWQDYGRDLTGALAADTVHFIEGVNINGELAKRGSSRRKASHVIVHGIEGAYVIEARPTWSPGDYSKVEFIESGLNTKNQPVLGRVGQRWLRKQANGEDEARIPHFPGMDPENGLYFPSMPEGDGHYWIGDTASITTGGDLGNHTPLDYRSAAKRVLAITLDMAKVVKTGDQTTGALSWHPVAEMDVERNSDAGPAASAATAETGPGCPCIGLCVAAVQTELEVQDHVDSGQAVGHFGILARDGDDGTSWSTNGFPVDIQHWGPDFGSAVVVNALRFLQSAGAANAATSINVYATNDDAKWATFDAWNNHNFDFVGNAWTLVDTLIGLTVGDNGTLSIAGSTAYRYWALRATAGGGNGWEVFTFTFYKLSGGDDTEEFVGTGERASRCDHQHHADNVIFEDGTTLEDAGVGGHVADPTDAHAASAVGFTPTGTIAATDVQAAIAEVAAEAGVTDHGALTGLADDDHSAYETVISGGGPTVQAHGAMGAAETVNAANGNLHTGTLDDDCTVTVTLFAAGGIVCRFTQDAGGGNGITWAGVTFAAGADDQPGQGANEVTEFVLSSDGSNVLGYKAGAGAGATALDDLTDVTITAPAEGDMLRFDGAVWVNTPGRWEVVTAGVDTFVWDGDELTYAWTET